MSNYCNCHGIPYINSNDNICRVKWAEYEAVIYFIKQGMTIEKAKEAVDILNIHEKMKTFLSEQLLRFQQNSKTTLSEKECKKLVQRFREENRPKPKRKHSSSAFPRSKLKKRNLNSKGQIIVTRNGEKRPLCLLCNRLARARYYKGEKLFDRYCDTGKDHSSNSKRKEYQIKYQKEYREKQKKNGTFKHKGKDSQ